MSGIWNNPSYVPQPFSLDHNPGNIGAVPNWQKTSGHIPGTQPAVGTPRAPTAQSFRSFIGNFTGNTKRK